MRSSSVSPYDLQDWAKRAGFELTEETLPPLAGYLGLLMPVSYTHLTLPTTSRV